MTRRFRKKPVVIEAMLYDGTNADSVKTFIGDTFVTESTANHSICIRTLEGGLHASVGDYIIKGIKGEFYPCKPDIFEATYDLVED